jgi:HSP20 family molecular chaperone IbpA
MTKTINFPLSIFNDMLFDDYLNQIVPVKDETYFKYEWKKENSTNKIFLLLSGYDKSEVQVFLERGLIKIVAYNKEFGKKSYGLYIPKDCNVDTLKTVLKNGILYITVDDKELLSEKPIKIEVN